MPSVPAFSAMPGKGPVFAEPVSSYLMEVPAQEIAIESSIEELDENSLDDLNTRLRNGVRYENTFIMQIMQEIPRRGYATDADFYKACDITRQHFSDMRKAVKMPRKRTVFSMLLALGLSLGEAESMLAKAGYSFTPSDPTDIIIAFCFERGIHELIHVNWLLDLFGEQVL